MNPSYPLSEFLKRKGLIWEMAQTHTQKNPSLVDLESHLSSKLQEISDWHQKDQITFGECFRSRINIVMSCYLSAILLGLEKLPHGDTEKDKVFAKVVDEFPVFLGKSDLTIEDLTKPLHKLFYYGVDKRNKKLGYTSSKRELSDTCKHCRDCKSFPLLGWQPLGVVPLPGTRCNCKNNCRCSIKYR